MSGVAGLVLLHSSQGYLEHGSGELRYPPRLSLFPSNTPSQDSYSIALARRFQLALTFSIYAGGDAKCRKLSP
jgi:hypothetical protein